jgi:anti-sigma factor RsiW
MSPDDRVQAHDINAYIDGELDASAARTVELYLSERPEAAAAAMSDLAIMHGLRAMASAPVTPSAEVRKAAERLQGGLRGGGSSRRVAAAALLTLVYLGGWATAQVVPSDPRLLQNGPEFVDEALMSHRTALLRARMTSQPEVTTIDRNEISAATNISLPAIPNGWSLTDAQVYPSDEGPSIGLAFRSPTGPVSLFAFHIEGHDSIRPTVVQRGPAYVSYWRTKDLAYVLIGPSDPRQLGRLAEAVAKSGGTGKAL